MSERSYTEASMTHEMQRLLEGLRDGAVDITLFEHMSLASRTLLSASGAADVTETEGRITFEYTRRQ